MAKAEEDASHAARTQMEEKVKEAFASADANQDGVLTLGEFSAVLKVLSPELWTDDKLRSLFAAADKDGSGTVDLQETLDWMFGIKPKDKEPDDYHSRAVMAAFARADINEDGELSKKEFGDLLQGLDSKKWTKKMIKQLFDEADEDKSGTVGLHEVRRWMTVSTQGKRGLQEPPTDEEEVYTLLTVFDGRPKGPLRLIELLEMFQYCKVAGLGPRMPINVPQDCEGNPREAEDVSGMELAHLFLLAKTDRSADGDDAKAKIADEKSFCRGSPLDLGSLSLDPEEVVGFGIFKQLLSMLTATMLIDRSHLLTTLAWGKTNRFEMTEAMGSQVMTELFLKTPKYDVPLISQPIGANDFNRLCFSMELIDATGRRGINQGRIAILFQDILKTMPKRIAERQKIRYSYRRGSTPGQVQGASNANVASNVNAQGRSRIDKKDLRGLTEVSILFETLFRALPPQRYVNCVDMVLSFLERARLNPVAPSKAL